LLKFFLNEAHTESVTTTGFPKCYSLLGLNTNLRRILGTSTKSKTTVIIKIPPTAPMTGMRLTVRP